MLVATSTPDFTSFGGVVTHLGANENSRALAMQTDGKFLVAGWTTTYGGTAFVENPYTLPLVVRYNSDGSLDRSFGEAGVFASAVEGFGQQALGVTVQPDGKVLVVGRASTGFAILRLSSDGAVDPTFGSAGVVTYSSSSFSSGSFSAPKTIVQADGKILLVTTGGMTRFSSTGTLDSTFGASGTAAAPPQYAIYDAVLRADGRIVASGVAGSANSQDFAVLQFTSAGTLDSSFGTAGRVTTDIGLYDYGHSVSLQSDGKVVVAGNSIPVAADGIRFAVLRYNADGTSDSGFGIQGRAVISFGGSSDVGNAVAIQPDGNILVAGYSGSGPSNSFALARLQPDGVLDASFASGGKVTTPVSVPFGNGYQVSLGLSGSGSILLAGYAHLGTTDDIAVAQYDASGNLSASATTVGTDLADTFVNQSRTDLFEGRGGIDVVTYASGKSEYVVRVGHDVSRVTSAGVTDALVGVERLHFADSKLALDLEGNAGMVAKLLGVTFGAAAVQNGTLVRTGLAFADSGLSYTELAALALSVAGATTPREVVELLWTNLMRSPPSDAQATPFVEMLSSGQISSNGLAMLAAEDAINAANIDLVGLQQNGLGYL